MEIVDNRKKQGVPYGAVPIGGCFFDKTNRLFMKIEADEAVSLTNGYIFDDFKPTDVVFLVKAKIVISDYEYA